MSRKNPDPFARLVREDSRRGILVLQALGANLITRQEAREALGIPGEAPPEKGL